ncbi:3-phosphoserine/phosphohydroxythreonine transaminase [Mucilaginibacter sp. UYCu711]|uniref:3-phosphoserine/phosphohydroxythreonine transaminase n=1 Tax=Mucilaginibacter sp. UYCu711 TaxID=3156339 RepID=UPI003D1D526E
MSQPRKHNFGAGPCILPKNVLIEAANGVAQLENSGLSVLEISHRSPDFEQIITNARNLVKELLEVPDDYSILFLQGGASMQFCMIPMNFLNRNNTSAAYLDAGYFGQKAIKEAELFGNINIVASSSQSAYDYIPIDFHVPDDAAYFHCTSNNTIEGTEMFEFPDTGVPLICDMSSDIFSRKIDVSRFSLIYAGAQKNMGPAGVTLVIVKDSFLENVSGNIPSMLDYRIYRNSNSLFNTPPVFAIYATMLNLRWLKSRGGVKFIQTENSAKAQLLYDEIDRNPLFYGLAKRTHRSLMNVTFRMYQPKLETDFLAYVTEQGIVGIQGYRTVGGFRASLYNALPYESVKVLVECMRAFAEQNN